MTHIPCVHWSLLCQSKRQNKQNKTRNLLFVLFIFFFSGFFVFFSIWQRWNAFTKNSTITCNQRDCITYCNHIEYVPFSFVCILSTLPHLFFPARCQSQCQAGLSAISMFVAWSFDQQRCYCVFFCFHSCNFKTKQRNSCPFRWNFMYNFPKLNLMEIFFLR